MKGYTSFLRSKNSLIGALLGWCLCCASDSMAQDTAAQIGVFNQLNIELNSSLVHPGIQLGYAIPRIYKQNISIRKGDTSVRSKMAYWSFQAGFYHHLYFHNNAYVMLQSWQERHVKKDRFRRFTYGAGFSRAFMDGRVYEVDDLGQTSIKRNPGQWYGLVQCGMLWGWNRQGKHMPYAGISQVTFFPYNNLIYPRLFVHAGLSLNGKRKKNVRVIKK